MTQAVPDRRRILTVIALLLAVGEYIDAFFVSFPAGPAGLATALLLAVLWIRRGGIAGPIAVAALFAFEDVNAPSWPRTDLGDWITTIAYGVAALAGLLVAFAVIKDSFQARKATAAPARVARSDASDGI